ncbi:unnamed protein product [Laminaria digitata]
MGLKKADPSRLKEILPRKDRSLDPAAMKSCLQKLRIFRYQMRNSLGGDNLDTPEELAQKGIGPNRDLGLGIGHRRNGSFKVTRGILEQGDGIKLECEAGQLSEAFEMPVLPVEFASAIECLDAPHVKRAVELMGQCVQVRGVEG